MGKSKKSIIKKNKNGKRGDKQEKRERGQTDC